MLKNFLLRPTLRQEKTELYDLKIEVPFAALAMVYFDPTILENYWKHGFYVLENVFGEEELSDLDQISIPY